MDSRHDRWVAPVDGGGAMIPNVPLVLVYGSNGSGKTTMIREYLFARGHTHAPMAFDPPDADLAFAEGDLFMHHDAFADVARLYAALSPPLALTIDRSARPRYAAKVAPMDRPHETAPLSRVGGALARLLYTATRAALAAHRGAPCGIDHPERDLDGHNRAAFARYLVALAARPGARLIIETNEQTFTLAAQLAIAKGEIAAADVRLLQVERTATGETRAQEIRFTPWGGLGDGAVNPNHADFMLACEVARAARAVPGSPRYAPETS